MHGNRASSIQNPNPILGSGELFLNLQNTQQIMLGINILPHGNSMQSKCIIIMVPDIVTGLESNGLSSTLHIIGVVFRRRFRGRRRRVIKTNKMMHVPSSVNNTLNNNTSLVFHAALAAGYSTTGTVLTTDRFENADRAQQCVIGSKIDGITFDIFCRLPETSGVVEWAILKIERSNVVPDTDNVILPNDTTIQTTGLQAALRQYQPGRVLKYGAFAVAPEQPATRQVGVSFKKFKMNTLRTGDYYTLVVFNRGITMSCVIDLQARYYSYT